jgi:glycogen synthase
VRVLMTADTVGGVWSYAIELSRAFCARGIDVSMATMGTPLSPAQEAEARDVPTLTLHPSRFKLEWMDEPWADVEAAGEWLLELERTIQPDVVHVNGFVHGALPWTAPVVVVGHSCVLSWWEAVRREPAPSSWNRYRDAVACGLHAADAVVTPTRALLEALSRFYGPPAHATVIPNGRAPARFLPSTKEEIILTAGRLWDDGKNVGAVCEAASAVRWPVYAAGETRGASGGERHISAAHALGRLDEAALAEWLGRASIYALPARYEPFGLSVLEAALARCALVLGDIPSLRENWDSAALFVDPEDVDALIWAIDRLADAPALREALAAEAHARARRLTPTRMAAAYASVYQEIGVPVPAIGGGGEAREMLCAS